MNRTPVVFLHGAWLHALSFASWADRFAGRGFLAVAPGWPGEAATVRATRALPEALGGLGLDTLTDHYGGIVRAFDTPPVIVGHSVGGLIAQHLLAAGWGRAAVSVAPAPINDVPLPHCPARPWTPDHADHADPGDRLVSLSPERFREVFANTAPGGGVRPDLRALCDARTTPTARRPRLRRRRRRPGRPRPAPAHLRAGGPAGTRRRHPCRLGRLGGQDVRAFGRGLTPHLRGAVTRRPGRSLTRSARRGACPARHGARPAS
ncbi:alpha/beta hydrolase [Streptomyces olivaceoviridis]